MEVPFPTLMANKDIKVILLDQTNENQTSPMSCLTQWSAGCSQVATRGWHDGCSSLLPLPSSNCYSETYSRRQGEAEAHTPSMRSHYGAWKGTYNRKNLHRPLKQNWFPPNPALSLLKVACCSPAFIFLRGGSVALSAHDCA